MTQELYNLRSDGDQYRITKFLDGDPVLESSYLLSHAECQCPAGHRATCRHRIMLPAMLEHGLLDSPLFWSYRNEFTCGIDGTPTRALVPEGLPPGVQILNLDDMLTVHNVSATAVGEPLFGPNGLMEHTHHGVGVRQVDDATPPHSVAASTPDFDSGSTGSNPVGATNSILDDLPLTQGEVTKPSTPLPQALWRRV